MKRTMSMAVSAVMALGLVAGCGSQPGNNNPATAPQSAAPQAADKPVTLKIGQLPIIDGLPFWVAEKNGYYKQQGVNVELVTFKSANERDAAIQGGQIDGMLADPIASATLYASGTKVQMTAIGIGVTKAEGPIGIVAAPESGITDVNQLKGVEIAISNNSVMHYVTEKLLLDAGFKPEEIKLVNMPAIPVRYQTLLSSKIKAATLPDPMLTMSTEGAKPGKLLVSDVTAKRNYSQSVIDFSEKAIKEKADGIKRFYIAYNQGVADIQAKPQDYMSLLTDKASLPAGAAMIAFKNGVMPFAIAQAPQKQEVEDVVNWLAEKQVIDTKSKPKPTYEQLVNGTLLPAK